MTKEYYFRIFGKLHTTAEDKKLLLVNRSFKDREIFDNENEYNVKQIGKLNFEKLEKKDSTTVYFGKYSFKMDSTNIYSPVIESPFYNITKKDHAWIKVTAYIYPTKDIITNPFSIVVCFSYKGYPYKYKHYDSEEMKLKLNEWNKIVFDYLTPEVRIQNDSAKVYLWNRGKSPFYLGYLSVDAYEKK